MKKFISSLVIMFAVAIAFSSCDKQDVETPNDNNTELKEKQEKEKLLKDLKQYNAQFMLKDRMNETRGLKSWLKRLLQIVYADAAGGLVCGPLGPWGAVGGAALSSAIAFCSSNAMLTPVSTEPTRGADLDKPFIGPKLDYIHDDALSYTVLTSNLTMCTDSVGYYHNKILMNLHANNLLRMFTTSQENAMIEAICNQAEEISFNGRGNTTNAQLLALLEYTQLKSICADPIYTLSLDIFSNELKGLYPNYEYELEVLKDFVNTLCYIDQSENDGTYAKGVLNIINESNVSNTVKKRLGEAVITGNASARMWNFN